MKKIVFLANLVAVSMNVFASPEGLTRLHRTDSFRFQLEMRDIPETEVEKSSPSKNLRKRKRITYVQTDSWPQEKDDSQDFDYIPSQNIKYGFEEVNPDSFVGGSRELIEQLPEKGEERVDNSVENIFEDVLAPYEFDSCRYNLRDHRRVVYVQPSGSGYSQFPEQDNSQDPDYISSQNVNGLKEVNSGSFVENSRELTEQPQEIDISQPFSSPNKKLKLKLNRDYLYKKLNVINNKDFLKKYRNFDNVEILVLTAEDLKYANKFKFPNLKELHIDILIKPAKPKKIGDSKKGNLKQLVLEELFSKKNQEIWRNHRLEKEHKDAKKKRQSRINKKELTKQLLSKELPILLSKNPDIERFSIQHISCKNLPMEIWNLKKLRSLTLKMTGITELSSEIQNLVNLEILDLSNNKIETLPEELGKLSNLREVNLYGNGLMKEFPNILVQLPNLEQLHIDEQQSDSWKKQLQNLQRINKKLKIEVW